MKLFEVKTIDCDTLTWFDKTNGNSYFAQSITINYGMEDEFVIKNPFQYGYGSFDFFCFNFLSKNYLPELKGFCSGWYAKEKYGIIFRHNVKNALKRELLNI